MTSYKGSCVALGVIPGAFFRVSTVEYTTSAIITKTLDTQGRCVARLSIQCEVDWMVIANVFFRDLTISLLLVSAAALCGKIARVLVDGRTKMSQTHS